MKHVVITCHSDGYRASIDEQPSAFGSGWDIREAIGDLVIGHPELFDCVLTRRHMGPEGDVTEAAAAAARQETR